MESVPYSVQLGREGAGKDHDWGKWKVEITFAKDRTPGGPNSFVVEVYENGIALGAAGDMRAYLCRDIEEKDLGCQKVFSALYVDFKTIAVCPHCKRTWNPNRLTTTVVYRLSTDKAAIAIAKIMRRVEFDADIFIKYHPSDIRYQEMVRELGLDKAATLQGLLVYKKSDLINAISTGKGLEEELKGLLSA